MGLVLKDGQWQLQAAGSAAGYDATAGAKGSSFLRNSASSVLTGSLLQPSGSVSQANIFSARGVGGTTGATSSKIYATRRVGTALDLDDFSAGFTFAAWIRADSNITNNNSTIFFSSQAGGADAVLPTTIDRSCAQ